MPLLLLLLLLLHVLLGMLLRLRRIHVVIPRKLALRRGSGRPLVGGVAGSGGRRRMITGEGHSLRWPRRRRRGVVCVARMMMMMMIGVRRMVRIRRGLMMMLLLLLLLLLLGRIPTTLAAGMRMMMLLLLLLRRLMTVDTARRRPRGLLHRRCRLESMMMMMMIGTVLEGQLQRGVTFLVGIVFDPLYCEVARRSAIVFGAPTAPVDVVRRHHGLSRYLDAAERTIEKKPDDDDDDDDDEGFRENVCRTSSGAADQREKEKKTQARNLKT